LSTCDIQGDMIRDMVAAKAKRARSFILASSVVTARGFRVAFKLSCRYADEATVCAECAAHTALGRKDAYASSDWRYTR